MEKQWIKNWNYNQRLDHKSDWYRYYGEYTLAIKNLLERSDQSQTTVLALPLLFMMRHSLELAFKYNILELEKLSGDAAIINYKGGSAHILSKLHEEFNRQVKLIFDSRSIEKEIIKDFKKRNRELTKFRVVFDKLDNWSYAFRYPVKNDGTTNSFGTGDEINISEIIPIYERTQIILKFTVDVLGESDMIRGIIKKQL